MHYAKTVSISFGVLHDKCNGSIASQIEAYGYDPLKVVFLGLVFFAHDASRDGINDFSVCTDDLNDAPNDIDNCECYKNSDS